MIPEDFTRYLPPLAYNKLKVTPPLTFRHVSARVFPLRANLDILQQLCDSYLNIVPPEAGLFRAPVPYVFLVILDYGQIGEKEMRTGWFSQVEVYFGVPVEWYKCVQGQWVFYDWGVITPYIFVSDSVSVPTGRMVYGYPKILAKVELTNSEWVKNPIAPTTLARISTTVFPKTYMGGNLLQRVFLEIDRAALTNWRLPYDPTCPNMPWMIGPNLAETLGGLGRDAFWLAQSMRICPVSPITDPSFLSDMLSRLRPSFAPDGDGFVLNSINLKQFRREDDPSKICFRALTNGPILTNAVNGAGLLGENHILLGDLTGAHSIRLFEQATLPIVQTLGLEVYKSWSDQGISVSEFKPVLPFWIDVDLTCNPGENIAWQSQDGIWKDGSGKPFPIDTPPNSDFNNTVSTSIEAIAGPFQFPGTTIRVIPLLACKVRLQKFLNEYLNDALHGPILREDGGLEPHEFRFELWARGAQAVGHNNVIEGRFASVFLTASSYKSVISSTNNVGDWAKFELSFMIPVKWQRRKKERIVNGEPWETIGVGLVPAFSMADNCVTSFSRLEIQGIPSRTAEFVRPQIVWLSEKGGTHPKQTLLQVNVELLTALGAGQAAKFEPVIEISANDPGYGFGNSPDAAWQWAEILRQELATKKAAKQQHFEELKIARALSLELLGNFVPFSIYTLKQFPDVADPDKACFQSLVRVGRTLTEITGVEEIEQTLTIRLYGYPDFDIVQELGIQAARLDQKAAGIVYCIQGLHPLYIRGTIDEKLGVCLFSRSGISPWTIHPPAFYGMLSEFKDAKGESKITVDRKAETLQDRIDPSRTAETMYECRQRWQSKEVPPWGEITSMQARNALDRLDPQIVIESILAREWSNFDPQARWRKGRLKLGQEFGLLPQDGVTKPYAEAELYRQINNRLAAPPGSVAGRISADYMQQIDDYQWLDPALFQAIRTAVLEGRSADILKWIESKQKTPERIDDCGPRAEPLLPPEPTIACGKEPAWNEPHGWLWTWVNWLKDQPCEEALKEVDRRWRCMVMDNLMGLGADYRWRTVVKEIILRQQCFTQWRDQLERAVDMLAPAEILGMDGLRKAYAKINAHLPPEHQLPFPDTVDFHQIGQDFGAAIEGIRDLKMKGQPSTRNNLDPVAEAEQGRLEEMLQRLQEELKDELNPGDSVEEWLCKLRDHAKEEGEIVTLARAKCKVQYEALINKLSRAFQKPDFCLRRDAFSPADRDRFLPLALSWDEDWYYGEEIELDPALAEQVFTGLHGCDEKRSRHAEYPPAGESQPPTQSVPERAASETSRRSAE
jgi:hypothetical protein